MPRPTYRSTSDRESRDEHFLEQEGYFDYERDYQLDDDDNALSFNVVTEFDLH